MSDEMTVQAAVEILNRECWRDRDDWQRHWQTGFVYSMAFYNGDTKQSGIEIKLDDETAIAVAKGIVAEKRIEELKAELVECDEQTGDLALNLRRRILELTTECDRFAADWNSAKNQAGAQAQLRAKLRRVAEPFVKIGRRVAKEGDGAWFEDAMDDLQPGYFEELAAAFPEAPEETNAKAE